MNYDHLDEEGTRPDFSNKHLTAAYMRGRDAARNGDRKTWVLEYAGDPLAQLNWQMGYDDWTFRQWLSNTAEDGHT